MSEADCYDFEDRLFKYYFRGKFLQIREKSPYYRKGNCGEIAKYCYEKLDRRYDIPKAERRPLRVFKQNDISSVDFYLFR